MKKSIISNYKGILSVLVLGLSVLVLIQLREQLADVKIINPYYLLLAILLIAAFMVVNGLITKRLLKCFGLDLEVRESIALSILNTLGNMITPFRGGMVSNAIYLKDRYKLDYSNFVAMLSATYVVVFWLNSLIGLIVCIYIKFAIGIFSWPIFAIFLLGTVILTIVMLFSPKINETRIPIVNKIVYVVNKWNLINKDKNLIMTLLLFSLLNTTLIVFINYFEFLAIGIYVSFEKLVFLSVFSIYSLFLSITPATLGVKEAFAVYSGLIVNISAPNVIVVSLVDRFLIVIVVLIFSFPASYLLMNKRNSKTY